MQKVGEIYRSDFDNINYDYSNYIILKSKEEKARISKNSINLEEAEQSLEKYVLRVQMTSEVMGSPSKEGQSG